MKEFNLSFFEAWEVLDKVDILQEKHADIKNSVGQFRGYTKDGEYLTDDNMPTVLDYACGIITLAQNTSNAKLYTDFSDPKAREISVCNSLTWLLINTEKIDATFSKTVNCTLLNNHMLRVQGQEKPIGQFVQNTNKTELVFEINSNLSTAVLSTYEFEIDLINNMLARNNRNNLIVITGKSVADSCKEKKCSVEEYLNNSRLHAYSKPATLINEVYPDFDTATNCLADGFTLNFDKLQELNSDKNDKISFKYKNPANKNKLTINDISTNKNKLWLRVSWKCQDCHHSYAQYIATHTKNSRCPDCTQKNRESASEYEIEDAINNLINIDVRYKNCGLSISHGDDKNRRLLDIKSKFDNYLGTDIVLLKDEKIVIAALEYDGSPWHATASAIANDEYKDGQMEIKNIKLMRVREIGVKEVEEKKLACFNKTRSDTEYSPKVGSYLKIYEVRTRKGRIAQIDANNVAEEFLSWVIGGQNTDNYN